MEKHQRPRRYNKLASSGLFSRALSAWSRIKNAFPIFSFELTKSPVPEMIIADHLSNMGSSGKSALYFFTISSALKMSSFFRSLSSVSSATSQWALINLHATSVFFGSSWLAFSSSSKISLNFFCEDIFFLYLPFLLLSPLISIFNFFLFSLTSLFLTFSFVMNFSFYPLYFFLAFR